MGFDRWQSSNSLANMNLLEGVSIDEQEDQIQEYISLSMNFANITCFFEKLEIQIEKNYRLIKRGEI